jgi:hypothetical protein
MGRKGQFFRRLNLNVPADTAKADAVEDSVELRSPHIVTGLLMHIPVGHEFETAFWFEKNGGRWLPDNSDGEIRGDGNRQFPVITPNSPGDRRVARKSATYELLGYNEDSQNPHEVQAYLIGNWGVPDG